MSKWGKGTMAVLAIAVVAYAFIQYGFFRAEDAGLVQTRLQDADFQLNPWVYVLYAHIACSVIPLAVGPFLFSKRMQAKRIQWHRTLGKLYVMSILIGGLAGLYVSLHAYGGWVSRVGFLGLEILWLFTTFMGLRAIRQKRLHAHQDWMIRSYALTFAGVTLRIWLGALSAVFMHDMDDFLHIYLAAAWLCWVPNLIFAELLIRRNKRKLQQQWQIPIY